MKWRKIIARSKAFGSWSTLGSLSILSKVPQNGCTFHGGLIWSMLLTSFHIDLWSMRCKRLERDDAYSRETRKRSTSRFWCQRKSREFIKWLAYQNWERITVRLQSEESSCPNTTYSLSTSALSIYYPTSWERKFTKSESKVLGRHIILFVPRLISTLENRCHSTLARQIFKKRS